MAAKTTRLTHKIAVQLHLVAKGLPFTAIAPGGQSGNFWIHPRSLVWNGMTYVASSMKEYLKIMFLCLSTTTWRRDGRRDVTVGCSFYTRRDLRKTLSVVFHSKLSCVVKQPITSVGSFTSAATMLYDVYLFQSHLTHISLL